MADTTYDEPQYTEPGYTEPAVDYGPPDVSVDDSINGGEWYAGFVQMIGGDANFFEGMTGDEAVRSQAPDAKGITPTGDSGGGSWLTKALDYVKKDVFGFSDAKGANNDFPKLLATGAALAIGGAGKAYSESKRLAQEKELADKRLLIESQNAGILQQKMANQNFSGVSFKAPPNGLINTFKPAKITPLQDRMKA